MLCELDSVSPLISGANPLPRAFACHWWGYMSLPLTPVQRYPLAAGGPIPKLPHGGVKLPSGHTVHLRFPSQRHHVGLTHDAQGPSADVRLKESLLETLSSNQRG